MLYNGKLLLNFWMYRMINIKGTIQLPNDLTDKNYEKKKKKHEEKE